jgi:pimeloyl-ACP methyl ester carboxylesterase
MVHFDRFYGSLDHLLEEFDRCARRFPVDAGSVEAFGKWRGKAATKLWELSGLDRMQRCDQEAKCTEEVEIEGMRRQRILLQTEPEVWMPLYVLIPRDDQPPGRFPCVIAAHGHGVIGKYGTVGRRDIPAVRKIMESSGGTVDYGLELCRRGYVVFCPDTRGFGERREIHRQGGEVRNAGDDEASAIRNSCSILARMAAGLGRTVVGMWTWDLMRLADYIIDKRDECDPDRLACVGCSGGGLQTLWFAALDERVKLAVVSGNFFGFRDSLLKQIRCDCSYVPQLFEYFDAGDIAAMIAPRPLLIETGTQDVLCGERGAVTSTEQVAITRQAYDLLEAGDRLHYTLFEGPHGWNGAETYGFMERWLK